MEIFTYEDYLNTIRGVAEEEEQIIKNTKEEKEKLYRIINYIFREKIGNQETERLLKN